MKYLLLIVFGIHIFNISYSQNRGLLAFRKLLVASSSTDTVAVNFYGTTGTGHQVPTANWNNIGSATGTVSGSNLLFLSNGSNSGVGVSFTQAAASNWADNGSSYCTAPTNGFPTLAFQDALYVTTSTVVTFSGLNNAKTYDIIWLGSRGTATHMNSITVGAASSSYEAANNCSTYGILTGLSPSGGSIAMTLNYSTGSFAYINAFKLVVH